MADKITITLKCFAFLAQYLPEGARGNTVQLELASGTTIGQLLQELTIDPEMVELVILNNGFVDGEARQNQMLKAQDTLALWPEVAGG